MFFPSRVRFLEMCPLEINSRIGGYTSESLILALSFPMIFYGAPSKPMEPGAHRGPEMNTLDQVATRCTGVFSSEIPSGRSGSKGVRLEMGPRVINRKWG